MYAILASIALSIYSIILVDFSLLYQEMAVNADMLTATQALYTAEGTAESTFSGIGQGNLASRNLRFADAMLNETDGIGDAYLPYNEGADSFYIQRDLSLNSADLKASDAYVPGNRIVRSSSTAYLELANGQTLDQKAFYGLEPRAASGFAFREVDDDGNFNEINFQYGLSGESSETLFEIFVFPREGSEIDFKNFEKLKEGDKSSVQRVVINTKDISQNGMAVPTSGQPLTVSFGTCEDGNYAKQVRISGFDPLNRNYILHFQTLDNQPIHYKLIAKNQGDAVMLPSMMQTIDVIGATPTGLYQRVKVQRQTEADILPGLNFATFSNGPVNK